MFILAVIAAILIGSLFGGKIKNLEHVNIKGVYLVFVSFLIEFLIVVGIKKEILEIGLYTYVLDLIMYIMLFLFIMLNRKNLYIIIMGIGFGLNAVVIFINGGAMPVSKSAMDYLGYNPNISLEGLYKLIDGSTRLQFLGDIIPIKFISTFIVSIGDIIAAVGLMLIIIIGMKKKNINTNKTA